MKKTIPLFLMLSVLCAPFVLSLILFDDKENINDNARGQWLNESKYVAVPDAAPWQLVWREQDCNNDCDAYINLLRRVKMALGKYSEKLIISQTENNNLAMHDNGLFIADHSGLLLLSYEADEKGAYKLLKDLKVLMKHGGA